MRDQEQSLNAEFLVLVAVELHPDRIERPLPHAPVIADLAHCQLGRGNGDNLIGTGGAKIDAESPVDQQHVEPHEAEDRPGAGAQKIEPDGEAQAAEYQHEDHETLGTQRAVRRQHGRKDRGFRDVVVVGCHAGQYRGSMARKTPRKPSKKASRKVAAKPAKKGFGKAAKKPSAAKPADTTKPSVPWTPAEVAEAFRRLRAARPEPKG